MKKFLILMSTLLLITSTLCACTSPTSETDSSSNVSSQSTSNSSTSTQYASDSVRYDCNGYPLNQYRSGKWSHGTTFGESNKPYRTQITEIVTKGNSTTIYTYENTTGFKNYLTFSVDNNEINVSGLNVHDWVKLYFNTDGDITKIK